MIKNTRGPLTALALGVAAMAASVSVPVGKPPRLARETRPVHERRGTRPLSVGAVRVAERAAQGG